MGAARLPDVLLAGTPKAGTTSVYEHLVTRPDVVRPTTKELYFLSLPPEREPYYPVFDRRDYTAEIHGRDAYQHCFPSKVGMWIDASPVYLYQRGPLKYMNEWDWRPQVLVVLRDPIVRLESLFRHLRARSSVVADFDGIDGFGRALLGEYHHLPGRRDLSTRPVLKHSVRHGLYDEWLKRWISVVGESNVHVIVLEEWQARESATVSGLERFLGLPANGRSSPIHANESRDVRSSVVHSLVKGHGSRLPLRVRKPLRAAYRALNFERRSGSARESIRNTTFGSAVRAELNQVYADVPRNVSGLVNSPGTEKWLL